MNVEVEKPKGAKPYIVGYVNKRDGADYHNAFAQTDQYEKPHPVMFHRGIQSYQFKTADTTMMREFSTQTPVPGLVIESRKDKVFEAKPYFTSEMWMKQREITALYVQRMVRGWLARKYVFLEEIMK